MAAGVNILLDCLCSMQFSPSDLGGGESYSGTQSFKADKVSVSETTSTTDHSTGQDVTENHRKVKESWEVTVDMKLYSAALLAAIRLNDLGSITITAPSGLGLLAHGIFTNIPAEYAAPSTLKFTIKAHGDPIQYV